MKARQLLPLIFAIIVPVVFGGCSCRRPPPSNVIERAVLIVRGSGDNTLVHLEDDAIKVAIEGRMRASNSIRSLGDLAGSGVSVNDILNAAPREQSLRNRISGELNRIARDFDSSNAIDVGAAVAEAHCGGLKQELATGIPSTARDYIFHFAIALAKSQIPTPPANQIRAVAEDLVKVAMELHAQTINDEAARRAYVKAMCKVP